MYLACSTFLSVYFDAILSCCRQEMERWVMNKIKTAMTLCLFAGSLFAAEVSVTVKIDDDINGWTQIEAGAGNNALKDGLTADDGTALWGVSNSADKDGMLYTSYSSLAGTTLPSTIQAGIYTLKLRVGAGNVLAFTGKNNISTGTNSDKGAAAGFFTTTNADAETTKNNMYTEFNGITGVTYTPPAEADPADVTWTTWTFTWEISKSSPLVGTAPNFGVYARTGSTGGAAFFDDSILTYSPGAPQTLSLIAITSH
jgi:hypothetical protein